MEKGMRRAVRRDAAEDAGGDPRPRATRNLRGALDIRPYAEGENVFDFPLFSLSGKNASFEDELGREELWCEAADWTELKRTFRSGKVPIDLHHSSMKAIIDPATGQPIPPVGWATELLERDGFGWARAAVDVAIAAQIRAGKLKLTSPAYLPKTDSKGRERPVALLSVAITSTPSFDDLPEISEAIRELTAAGLSTADAKACILRAVQSGKAEIEERRARSMATDAETAAAKAKADAEAAAGTTGQVTRAEFDGLSSKIDQVLRAVTTPPAAPDPVELEVKGLVETARGLGKLSAADVPNTVRDCTNLAKGPGKVAGVKRYLDSLPVSFAPDAGAGTGAGSSDASARGGAAGATVRVPANGWDRQAVMNDPAVNKEFTAQARSLARTKNIGIREASRLLLAGKVQ